MGYLSTKKRNSLYGLMNKPRNRRLTNKLYQSNWHERMKPTAVSMSINLRLCLRVWRGGEGKALGGEKYRENLRNLSHFLEEYCFRVIN